MRKIILILGLLVVISGLILSGCTGTEDNDSNVPSPPGLPEEIEPTNVNSGNNLAPPALPEE